VWVQLGASPGALPRREPALHAAEVVASTSRHSAVSEAVAPTPNHASRRDASCRLPSEYPVSRAPGLAPHESKALCRDPFSARALRMPRISASPARLHIGRACRLRSPRAGERVGIRSVVNSFRSRYGLVQHQRPRDMSARGMTSTPRACSGEMYPALFPTTAPAALSPLLWLSPGCRELSLTPLKVGYSFVFTRPQCVLQENVSPCYQIAVKDAVLVKRG